MRSIESEGDSIDEAIAKALGILELSRERVEIEILSNATRGLFGFGGQKARVRATVRPTLAASGLIEAEAPVTAPVLSVSREAISDARSSPERPRNEARRDARIDAPIARRTDRTDHSTDPHTALGPRARTVLSEILSLLGASCTVELQKGNTPGSVVLSVNGDNSGLLIGRRGQTLDALEYMVNRIVSRAEEAGPGRIVIDVERYRERRQEYLESLAHRLADKSRQTGRVVTLNPMSPRDRRIVHIALREDASVETRSQGQGYYRRILIVPAARARGTGQRASRQEG
jgi:spoIIIJ-associated protein